MSQRMFLTLLIIAKKKGGWGKNSAHRNKYIVTYSFSGKTIQYYKLMNYCNVQKTWLNLTNNDCRKLDMSAYTMIPFL